MSDAPVGFLTVAEVAEQMRVSTMTVYRLIKAASWPRSGSASRTGSREHDVDRYLASRYTEAG